MTHLAFRPERPRLTASLALSVALHGAVVAGVIGLAQADHIALPPVYKVDLVAAPAGPRAIGQVQAPAATPTPAAPVPRTAVREPAERVPVKAPPPRRPAPPVATQVPNASRTPPGAAAPRAGGGSTGGQGTDVANVQSPGIEFPFPSYLNNIANQIILNFDKGNLPALSCDVSFLIRRDGSVTSIEIRRRSGSTLFDIEARGAVEAAGRSRAFGPLPDGFSDDVLPVIFTFTPQMIRR
ncbi:MAG: TonB C-terminal domain-containing protein [Gemmatimonadaceae bacterium]|nr:TonB C-terminal domain-containing protein [Gemmatimonadaceae bacterium]